MKISLNDRHEHLWLALSVLILTPVLYVAFRYLLLIYGLVWVIMLSIGPISKKYPRVKLFQFGLFISLVISLLLGMIVK